MGVAYEKGWTEVSFYNENNLFSYLFWNKLDEKYFIKILVGWV